MRDCNNCGRCCDETPCNLSLTIVADSDFGKPCPALERHGEQYLCGLYLDTLKYVDEAKYEALPSYLQSELRADKIPTLLDSAFSNQCNSHFGLGEKDYRIPIHFVC